MVVLEAHRLISIDTSGLDALLQLRRALARKDIPLVLCEVNEQPLGLVHRAHHDETLGPANVVKDLPSALLRARQLIQ